MRNRFLVSYDISNPKRLRKTFKKMRGFGESVQYSVFVCPLSPQEKILLLQTLKGIINEREDRVMLVDLGPVDGRGGECFEFLGHHLEFAEAGAVVV